MIPTEREVFPEKLCKLCEVDKISYEIVIIELF